MGTQLQTREDLWEEASDPILLLDGNILVCWANRAARELAKKSGLPENELSSYLPADVIKQVYAVQQFGTLQIRIPLQNLSDQTDPSQKLINQVAVVVELGSGEPGEEFRLLILKTPFHSTGYFGKYDEFLATVTHDLKNPLGAIHGYADLLLDTPAGVGLSDKQREVLNRIRNSSLRMIELIRNYQYLFKMQAEDAGITVRSDRPTANIIQVLQSVIEYSWREGPQAPILVVEIEDPTLSVALERINLERVLSNIVSNAVQHTPPGKQLSVHVKRDGPEALISVKNEGSHIPAELIPKLFTIYGKGSGVLDKSGSGLGLYIVKTIVDRAKGSVALKSDSQSGTEFTVRLPLALAKP